MRHNWDARLAIARSNLEWILKRATDNQITTGLNWYQAAQDSASEIATRFNLPLTTVLGVIAALSPGLRWERNIEYANKLIDLWSNGGDPSNATQFAVYAIVPSALQAIIWLTWRAMPIGQVAAKSLV